MEIGYCKRFANLDNCSYGHLTGTHRREEMIEVLEQTNTNGTNATVVGGKQTVTITAAGC
jgi:hypothetical protein